MKKTLLYFLLAGGVSMSATVSAQELSQSEKTARNLYFKALEKYESGDYKDAVKNIEEAEKTLTKTNARLSYLKTKALVAMQDYLSAQKSCANYFGSTPIQDDGFKEMNSLNNEIAIHVDSLAAVAAEERAEAAKKEQQAAAQAAERALLMKKAAERRAQDAKNQVAQKADEEAKFKAVQAKNTKEAYQQFIYDYPSGYFVNQAKSEMNKKWPAPTRMLLKNKYGYKDKSGAVVIKAKYDYASDFCEGMARVAKAGKYGFVDETGKEIIPMNYVTASNFNYGWAVLKTAENEAFFVNKKGEKMNEYVYYDAKAFSEGLAAVQNEYNLYGFIDAEGNEVIPNEFVTVSWFKEGLVAVSKRIAGKLAYGYVDKAGNNVTEFEFEDAKDFQNGIACVKKNGKYGLIDKFGSPITECEFDYISPSMTPDGYFVAKKNGWDVYLDKEGASWAKANGKYVKVNF